MKPSLAAVTPMMTLSDVAEQMDAFGIDCLPVVDDDTLASRAGDFGAASGSKRGRCACAGLAPARIGAIIPTS